MYNYITKKKYKYLQFPSSVIDNLFINMKIRLRFHKLNSSDDTCLSMISFLEGKTKIPERSKSEDVHL